MSCIYYSSVLNLLIFLRVFVFPPNNVPFRRVHSEEHEKKVSLIKRNHSVIIILTPLFFLMASLELCQRNYVLSASLVHRDLDFWGLFLLVETCQHKISRGTESVNSFVKVAIRTVKSVPKYSFVEQLHQLT